MLNMNSLTKNLTIKKSFYKNISLSHKQYCLIRFWLCDTKCHVPHVLGKCCLQWSKGDKYHVALDGAVIPSYWEKAMSRINCL